MYSRIDLTYSRSPHPNGPWRKQIFKCMGEQKLFLESNGEGWHLDHWGGLVSQQYSLVYTISVDLRDNYIHTQLIRKKKIYIHSFFDGIYIHSLWDKAASNVD
jgi:hypothetical protein